MVGRVVADLPVEVGWEIRHTVGPGEDDREVLAFIGQSDFYLLLLGGDFAAPMGLELRKAQRQGKRVLAYRKHIPHSPSAQRLLRQSDLIWTTFQTLLELKRETSRALAEAILDRGECLGLHMHEVQALLKITESKEEKGETSD
ncbi:MAG: hypothetical protein PVF04_01385, partial [Anaerolineae bacterium]